MDRSRLDTLNAAATQSAFRGDQDSIAGLTAALEQTSDTAETVELLLGRAVARQIEDDPGPSAVDALSAVALLQTAGMPHAKAAASAVAAGFVLRTGDLDHAIELAVDAMVALSEEDATSRTLDVVRAYNALSVIFSRLAAFELAVDAADSAGAVELTHNVTTQSIVAYNLCSSALERLRAPDCSAEETSQLVAKIERAIDFLCSDVAPETARLFVGPGMRAELAILGFADPSAMDALYATDTASAEMPPQMAAWHRLVRSLVARHRGDLESATVLLDQALVTLQLPSAEEHNLLRAMRSRAELRSLTGDAEGAVRDLERVVARLHRSQLDQVGRMSSQIRHRANSEIARAKVRKEAADLTMQMAVDTLTGVRSRHWLIGRIAEFATSQTAGAVIMIDLDHFKEVNDTFGHAVGDQVLARVGAVLLESVRPGDDVARMGGEEFVLILPGTALGMARERAERITDRLRSFDWSEIAGLHNVTASAGVSAGNFSDLTDLIEIADQRLYIAKRTGRDRVVAKSNAT